MGGWFEQVAYLAVTVVGVIVAAATVLAGGKFFHSDQDLPRQ